jgi:hypothetical protein
MSLVEQAYREAVDRMTPAEKIRRAGEMLRFARRVVATQLQKEKGELAPQQLRWEVALRLYGQSKQLHALIEEQLRHVSS